MPSVIPAYPSAVHSAPSAQAAGADSLLATDELEPANDPAEGFSVIFLAAMTDAIAASEQHSLRFDGRDDSIAPQGVKPAEDIPTGEEPVVSDQGSAPDTRAWSLAGSIQNGAARNSLAAHETLALPLTRGRNDTVNGKESRPLGGTAIGQLANSTDVLVATAMNVARSAASPTPQSESPQPEVTMGSLSTNHNPLNEAPVTTERVTVESVAGMPDSGESLSRDSNFEPNATSLPSGPPSSSSSPEVGRTIAIGSVDGDSRFRSATSTLGITTRVVGTTEPRNATPNSSSAALRASPPIANAIPSAASTISDAPSELRPELELESSSAQARNRGEPIAELDLPAEAHSVDRHSDSSGNTVADIFSRRGSGSDVTQFERAESDSTLPQDGQAEVTLPNEIPNIVPSTSVDARNRSPTIGEAHGATDIEPASIPRQLASSLVSHAKLSTKDSETQFEMRLDPPELGRVTVQLRQSDAGLTAHIVAAREATVPILERELPVLQATLENAGFAVDDFDVSHHSGEGTFQDDDREFRFSELDDDEGGVRSVLTGSRATIGARWSGGGQIDLHA